MVLATPLARVRGGGLYLGRWGPIRPAMAHTAQLPLPHTVGVTRSTVLPLRSRRAVGGGARVEGQLPPPGPESVELLCIPGGPMDIGTPGLKKGQCEQGPNASPQLQPLFQEAPGKIMVLIS